MTLPDQLADFNAFATRLMSAGDEAPQSLDELYDRWWAERHRHEDLEAIRRSAADYERGERGEDARAELASHRRERRSP